MTNDLVCLGRLAIYPPSSLPQRRRCSRTKASRVASSSGFRSDEDASQAQVDSTTCRATRRRGFRSVRDASRRGLLRGVVVLASFDQDVRTGMTPTRGVEVGAARFACALEAARRHLPGGDAAINPWRYNLKFLRHFL
jgi:hypothetical protein